MTTVGDAPAKIAEVNDLLQSGICCMYFSLARTERSASLSFTEPANGSTIFEYDVTVHDTKIEERKESTIGNR